MKTLNAIAKVLAVLAAVAGAVYLIAAYGDKIVAWAKRVIGCCPWDEGMEEESAEEPAAPEAPAEEPAQPTPPAEETGGDGGETSYTVVSGDCLWTISYHFYGTGAKFTRIAEATGLKDPYLIHIGQVLVIPAA